LCLEFQGSVRRGVFDEGDEPAQKQWETAVGSEEHGGEAALKEAALAAHQTRVVARKARGKETEGDVRRAMRRDARRSLKQQRKLEALQDQEK
jgi:hypothetical protein